MKWLRNKIPFFSDAAEEPSTKTFNRMSEKLESSLQQIRAEKDEIAAILRSMAEQVIAVDSSGNIFLLNPAAEKLFAVQSQETIGKPFVAVIRQAALCDILRFVLNHHQDKSEEIQLFLPEERCFEARALPIQSEGRYRGALLVLHDITRIQKLEKIRRDFVANVSHELRTPLTSIQGFAETLLSGALSDPEHNREFIETIQTEAERLTHLVEDLLNLSAIESGKKKLNLSSLSILDILKEVEESLNSFAQKHTVTLEIVVPAKLPPLHADRDAMKQLFMNLVDNAIKFNKKNGKVILEAVPNGDFITISIQDTGIGIPEQELPRIFERFYRVDKARSRELGGTGLGLSIVKHILEAHSGTIRVESAAGKGSTFFVTLPQCIQKG